MSIIKVLFTAAMFLCLFLTGMAQEKYQVVDTLGIYAGDTSAIVLKHPGISAVSNPIDTTVLKKRTFSGLELVVDYGKLLLLWTEFESKYEAGINLRFFERVVLAAEFGHAELNPLRAYDNALFYTVTGNYARLGLDYYTAYNPTSFYYAGLRYGMAGFEDAGAFIIDSDYWEDYQEGFGSKNITATWGEVILGTETFIYLGKKDPDAPFSPLLLGWKFRLRFIGEFENRENPRIYSIPGYGRTFDSIVPAINFYVKYRIGN
ncbi:MAG: hypothetical protein HC819_05320 [Cyclobacteriaceae bacterium]|nr:hypothetical protein [Cyclobacteriaceae bacterium]